MLFLHIPFYQIDHIRLEKYKGLPWEVVTTSGPEFLCKVEEIHQTIEFPTLSSGTFNQYKLLEKCNELGIQSAWDGLGADALYGGHNHYRHLLAMEYLGKLKIAAAYHCLNQRNKPVTDMLNSLKFKLRGIIDRSDFLKMLYIRYTEDLKLFDREFLAYALNSIENKHFNGSHQNRLKDLMNKDYFQGGVQHLARFSDRLADHFNVDLNYPYAENIELANFISCLPNDYLFKGGRSKALLRDSFVDLLPQPIYNRRDKIGMISPNNKWIDEHADEWIQYFEVDKDKIYNMKFLKDNYHQLWGVKNKNENYRVFKHISFAIWRNVFGL